MKKMSHLSHLYLSFISYHTYHIFILLPSFISLNIANATLFTFLYNHLHHTRLSFTYFTYFRLHPLCLQTDLVNFCKKHNILCCAYSSLAPASSWRKVGYVRGICRRCRCQGRWRFCCILYVVCLGYGYSSLLLCCCHIPYLMVHCKALIFFYRAR